MEHTKYTEHTKHMEHIKHREHAEYIKEETSVCPINHRKTVHTLTYKKATCTRVPDTLLHFACGLNPRCKECMEEYL